LVQLLEKHKIERIDIFHTDLEGYDFKVFRQLDFGRWRPKLLLYEHKHMSPAEKEECSRFLKALGYRLIIGTADALAVDRGCR